MGRTEARIGLPPRPDFSPRDPEAGNTPGRLLRLAEEYRRKSVELKKVARSLRGSEGRCR